MSAQLGGASVGGGGWGSGPGHSVTPGRRFSPCPPAGGPWRSPGSVEGEPSLGSSLAPCGRLSNRPRRLLMS